MEYGLRPKLGSLTAKQLTSLNPCCNGIWSQTKRIFCWRRKPSLNPCCNGIWSQTDVIDDEENLKVLILVVMEYGLRQEEYSYRLVSSLNPCCNGIWSQTFKRLSLVIEKS